jgi:acyl carrier protein
MPDWEMTAGDTDASRDLGQSSKVAWIRQRVLQAIAEEAKQPADAITERMAFEELGFDSLNVSTIILQLEKSLGIEIDTEDLVWFHEVDLVGDVIRVMIKILHNKGRL